MTITCDCRHPARGRHRGRRVLHRGGGTAARAGGRRGRTRRRRRRRRPGGGFGGPAASAGSAAPRLPMTVELASVKRADMAEQITVVGNLIGAATVEAVAQGQRPARGGVGAPGRSRQPRPAARQDRRPRAARADQAGRGVLRGRRRRPSGSAKPTCGSRRRTSIASQNLFERAADSAADLRRHRGAVSGVGGAARSGEGAVHAGAGAARRAEDQPGEHRHHVAGERLHRQARRSIPAPGSRRTRRSSRSSTSAPSGWSRTSSKRTCGAFRRGCTADVEVDAFPGEKFTGRVARIAPVLDPATRTAQIEVEIPNSQFRLKPGMYATVDFTVERRENTLVVPANALVDVGGQAGRVPAQPKGDVAKFQPIEIGMINQTGRGARRPGGGHRVVTTGAAALREGDRIVLLGQANAGRGRAPAGPARRHGARAAASAAVRPRRRPRAGESAPDRPRTSGASTGAARPTRGRPPVANGRSRSRHEHSALRHSAPGDDGDDQLRSSSCSGGISLTRLPVDLLPDISQPTISVRVNYTGVGPLEMEELDHPAARAAAERGRRARADELELATKATATSSMNFTWGPDLNEAMDEIRTRIDRVRGRLPEDAEPPMIQKFDSNAAPIMGLAVESVDGTLDRVALREMAENVLSPRLERVPGVAAVTVNGGLRRQIHVELSREKITALDLSVDRVVNVLRTENQNIPIGEVYQGDRAYPAAQPGPVRRTSIRSANLVVLTQGRRAGLPEGHRRGQGLDRGHPIGAADQRPRRASACRSRSSRAPTPCRSPRACARRSSASTARCRASS